MEYFSFLVINHRNALIMRVAIFMFQVLENGLDRWKNSSAKVLLHLKRGHWHLREDTSIFNFGLPTSACTVGSSFGLIFFFFLRPSFGVPGAGDSSRALSNLLLTFLFTFGVFVSVPVFSADLKSNSEIYLNTKRSSYITRRTYRTTELWIKGPFLRRPQ